LLAAEEGQFEHFIK